MLCFRKFMGYMIKVFPLRTYLLIFHLGHLHFLSFCPHLLGSSCFSTLNLIIPLNYLRLRQRSF
uniref:Uncharacterized protein n=1 Tax=Arundo donax TaxID=35708 RepID=A0A0A9FFJ5_ARUDO